MFRSARVKLTVSYLAIIMLISIAFSTAMYNTLSREVDRFARGRFFIERHMQSNPFAPPEITIIDTDFIAETKHRIISMLALINGIIFVLSGVLAYVLAGRTLRPIEAMVNEQNRFVSDASHEFKTPLTSLKSAFEVHLRDKKRTLRSSDTVMRESISEVDKLQSLSESLLTLAQLEHPNGSAKMESLRLSSVIQAAVKDVSPMAVKKHISIRQSVSDTQITGHRYNLIQLFVILLDNAIKYSKRNSTVTITDRKLSGSARIDIRDEGIGIPKEDQAHIFDRFYRANSARTKNDTGGFGLGLSIAKKIIDAHGGTITVASISQKGSTFTVRLPA